MYSKHVHRRTKKASESLAELTEVFLSCVQLVRLEEVTATSNAKTSTQNFKNYGKSKKHNTTQGSLQFTSSQFQRHADLRYTNKELKIAVSRYKKELKIAVSLSYKKPDFSEIRKIYTNKMRSLKKR